MRKQRGKKRGVLRKLRSFNEEKGLQPRFNEPITVVRTVMSVFGAALALGLAVLWGLQLLENMRWSDTKQAMVNQRRTLTTNTLASQSRTLSQFVRVASRSDEFARFMKGSGTKWAEETLVPSMKAIRADALWIYSPTGEQRFSAQAGDLKSVDLPLLSRTRLAKWLGNKSETSSFFVETEAGFVELFGAKVVTARNAARSGKTYGYLVIGRAWGNSTIKIAEELTGTRIRIRALSDGDGVSLTLPDQIRWRSAMVGANGKVIGYQYFLATNPLLGEIQSAANRRIRVYTIGILTLFLILAMTTGWIIGRPMRIIRRALSEKQMAHLSPIHSDRTEFGDVARLIQDSFAMEKALRRNNDNLEVRVAEPAEQVIKSYAATIKSLVTALEYRDQETAGHCERVTEMAVMLAREMNVPESDLLQVERGALLHDIGKIGVPDSILLKPGKLTDAERTLMQTHPRIGYDMLAQIDFLKPALQIPLCHHEKWDGTGYPNQLKGEDIPLFARIFALVDIWDALSSDRPYRQAWPPEQVMAHIHELSGTHLDPQVVFAFTKLQKRRAEENNGDISFGTHDDPQQRAA